MQAPTPRSRGIRAALLSLAALPFLTSGDDRPTLLDQIQQRGSLTMLTRNGASTYYLGPEGPTGPEVELVRTFAEFLGVELRIEAVDAFGQLAVMLDEGRGDLIAANLTRTPEREQRFRFGPDYFETTTAVVYLKGRKRPRSLEDLVGKKVMVIAESSYEEVLEAARRDIPDLQWEPRADVGMEELLLAVADGAIDATLVDSHIYKLNGHYYPRVVEAFTLPESQPQAWAFRRGSDDSLVQMSRHFLYQAKETGRLAALHDAFYEQAERMDRVGMFQFMRQVRERLPPLIPLFKEAGDANGLDWRLLAAIGYQESHWDPLATSFTGVRGIMMLTERTATLMGLTDRLDPGQSIDGGARYLLRVRKRLPGRIAEPDRTWFALAAYNLGLGHLEDARVLTEKQGGNPNAWDEVKERLPLLSQEAHYRETRYGFARGYEAKRFVENIQNYYETLVWMDTREHPLLVVQR